MGTVGPAPRDKLGALSPSNGLVAGPLAAFRVFPGNSPAFFTTDFTDTGRMP